MPCHQGAIQLCSLPFCIFHPLFAETLNKWRCNDDALRPGTASPLSDLTVDLSSKYNNASNITHNLFLLNVYYLSFTTCLYYATFASFTYPYNIRMGSPSTIAGDPVLHISAQHFDRCNLRPSSGYKKKKRERERGVLCILRSNWK